MSLSKAARLFKAVFLVTIFTTPIVKMPFQNLKFLIILNKTLGLVSCKLTNGRFKPSSIYDRCYCILWILFHCTYSGIYYYVEFTTALNITDVDFALSIIRYSAFFASLIPYHFVVVSRSQDFVKFSDRLVEYDDKVAILGHRRKDNHIFIWLYFLYTLCTLSMKSYYLIEPIISVETWRLVKMIIEEIVPMVIGTYCVFITTIFLDMIRQRFRHLNEIIVPRVSELPVTGTEGEITVYDVRYLHGILIDNAKLIDSLYGMGTLIIFTSILLEFVAVIYLFIVSVLEDQALVQMMDLLFQAIYLFAMYHFTTLEANRVEKRVIKYGLSFRNTKYQMDRIEMILYFYHTRFFFTAAEFFILDLTILISIASTVATFITLIA